MEIKGKVVKVMPKVTGEGKNGSWTKQEFVILEDKDQYPKSIAIQTFKDFNINVGDKVNASINIESREYNERWYTDITAWKYDLIEKAGAPANNDDPADDLPF